MLLASRVAVLKYSALDAAKYNWPDKDLLLELVAGARYHLLLGLHFSNDQFVYTRLPGM